MKKDKKKRENDVPPIGYPIFGDDLFFPYYNEKMNCDPLGSWTGVPLEPLESPTQDADDL